MTRRPLSVALVVLAMLIASCGGGSSSSPTSPTPFPTPAPPPPTPPPPPARKVVESRIDGEFTGWTGSTIFRLRNGQIWQQNKYDYYYHYAYFLRPRVFLDT